MIAARLTLTVSCLLLAAANAHPHHQFAYSGGLHAQRQTPQGGFYYVPQADAGSVVSVQRYAAPVPVGLPPPGSPQYVLLYPGGGGHTNFIHGRADPDDETRPTIWNLWNVFQRPTTVPTIEAAEDEVTTTRAIVTSSTTAATTVEETTPKPNDETSAKPEKIMTDKEKMIAVEQPATGSTDERKASLENLDENLPQTASDGRQLTLVQRPQFFGNYDFLNQGNMHQRFGLPPGAVSNFLLFRNGFPQPGVFPVPAQPGRPLKQVEVPAVSLPYIAPGSAALAFQQDLKVAQQKHMEANGDTDGVATRLAHIPGSTHVDVSHVFRQGLHPHFYVAPNPGQQVFVPRQVADAPGIVNVGPGYQNVFLVSPGQQGVVVDADRPRKDGDVDQVEAEQAGPSVAQAKPQAIALAGVGGLAAASPVATAVVGPGGLAVSAPTATAVAGGPSGGGALVGPAQAAIAAVNKHVTKPKTKNRDTSYDYADEEDNGQ